jgi:hypothetical protein
MSLLTSLAQLTSNCSYFAYISRALAEATYMKPIVAYYRVSTQKQARSGKKGPPTTLG